MRAYGTALNRIKEAPFKFKLSDLIPNDSYVRTALTREQQEQYLNFVREYGDGNYYDDIVVLLGTGLRVSELYGLTKADIDFERRCLLFGGAVCTKKYAEPSRAARVTPWPLSFRLSLDG